MTKRNEMMQDLRIRKTDGNSNVGQREEERNVK